MRMRLRSVSARSRNDSAGGRLRRTSTGVNGYGGGTAGWPFVDALGFVSVVVFATVAAPPLQRGRFSGVPGLPLTEPGARKGLDARFVERPPEPLPQLDLRLPAEDLASERDVRLADLRVVGRQRLVDDLRSGPGDLDHGLRELEQRELVGIADVDRLVVAGLGEPDDAVDEVGYEAERARLRAVAEHGDRPVLERLAEEGRD